MIYEGIYGMLISYRTNHVGGYSSMRLRNWIGVYLLFMGLACVGCLFCLDLAKQQNLFPEGVIVAGAVLGFISCVYGSYIREWHFRRKIDAMGAGPLVFRSNCLCRYDKGRTQRPCFFAAGRDGVIIDMRHICYDVIRYEEFTRLEVHNGELLIRANRVTYEFEFEKPVTTYAAIGAIRGQSEYIRDHFRKGDV